MRRRRQLNHTQRRVAAVSFLSNVACGDSKSPRLDCLQNTEVLESYRRSRSKRRAERREEAVQTKPRPSSGSRERTPEQRENPSARKLSCRQQSQDASGQIQRKRIIYQSQWSEDGTLDSTNNSTPSHPIARWFGSPSCGCIYQDFFRLTLDENSGGCDMVAVVRVLLQHLPMRESVAGLGNYS